MTFWAKFFGQKKDDVKPEPPWRRFHNEGKDQLILRKKIERFTLRAELGVHQARILMIGQIGAGKSSFFNTINSIFSGVITHRSPCGSAAKSFTTVYRQYHVRSNTTGSNLKFCLCDTCGLEDSDGPILEDMKYLLDGSVPDGYEFNASQPINPNIRGFRKRPGLEDQVHCVAFVIDGSTVEGLDDTVWEKLKNVQHEISKRGIPRVILLTKVDKLFTGGNISKVFESSQVSTAVNKVSETLGIPRHNVHPIKNYEKEMQLNDDIDRLALIALEQLTTFARDFVEQKVLSLSRIKPWRQEVLALNRENTLMLMEKIKTYAPPSDLGIPFSRILMIGPVDAGKSSFFDTINSVFSGRITQQNIDGGTTVYRQYQIQTSMTGTALKFRLCDTCGIEKKPSSYLMDLMYVINGHVPDRYKFNSSTPITPDIPGFKQHPGLKDKVHCVVFVFDASTIDTIAESIWEKLNDLQVQLKSIGLPRAVLLTKIDKISQTLHDDLSIVFQSEDVDVAVQKIVKMLYVPPNKIYPIKNYEVETSLNDKISTLSLLALDQILGFADDFLSSQRNTNEEEDHSMFFLLAALVLLVALAIVFSKLFGI